MEKVYRVQDAVGRGPFKPGFSKEWVDDSTASMPPTWMEEFGYNVLVRCGDRNFGSACRTRQGLKLWFSGRERKRLSRLGYSVVALSVDEILAESANQLVFARELPLAIGVIRMSWRF